jgi:carboxypeptidase Taq
MRVALRAAHSPVPTAVRPRSRARAMATATNADYTALSDRLREVTHLSGVSGLLGWDEQTMMPEGAADLRAKQQSALAGVVFEKETALEIGQLLQRLQATPPQDPWQAAVVRDAARNYKRKTALSKELAQREARLSSEGYQAWVAARKASDFSAFAPVLRQWLELTKEKCAAIEPSKPAYDVCVDTYERGLSSARLDEVFATVRAGLVPLLAEVRSRGVAPDDSWLKGEWDLEKQAAMCKEIAVEMGFDLTRGRLDVSVHPFTGGAGPTDVRMTTRFKAHDLMEGLTGAVHETGHALYEQGRPGDELDGLPVSEALSMGVHESQSLLWERCVALSPAFAEYLLPKLHAAFPAFPKDKTAKQLYEAMNTVTPRSLIRVEADELNYPLHIILRYELESALVKGTIAVEDLPRLWNERMQSYLGVTPDSDAQGVLQDVHWSAGAFGYFPTYSLGAMMAVQLFEAAKKDMPTLDADIAAGRFSPLREWLRVKIHSKGSLYPTLDELLIAATGEPLRPEVFLAHLERKYKALYKL